MPAAYSPEPAFGELSFDEKVRSTGHRNLAFIPPISGRTSTIAGIPVWGKRAPHSYRGATGEFAHVEPTPGHLTIVPMWKVDPVYCVGLKVGAPEVLVAAPVRIA